MILFLRRIRRCLASRRLGQLRASAQLIEPDRYRLPTVMYSSVLADFQFAAA
jgi:hypothetical protein